MVAGVMVNVNRGYVSTSSCTESNNVYLGSGTIYNCCTTDRCNGSTALSSSLSLAFALVAAVAVFKTIMAN